jgi:uncharacterized membrane protein YeaQ/YmgE (transglycosylase-associated protein family)
VERVTGHRDCLGQTRNPLKEPTHLSNESLVVIIVVGIVAGWLADNIVRGGGYGLVGDLIVGIIGAFIGDRLLPRLGGVRATCQQLWLDCFRDVRVAVRMILGVRPARGAIYRWPRASVGSPMAEPETGRNRAE